MPLFRESSPQKRVRLSAKRRRKKVLTAGIVMVFAACVVGLLGFSSHLDRVVINHVDVVGNVTVPQDAVVGAVNAALHDGVFRLFSRANIFLYPDTVLEETLKTNELRFEDVQIERSSLLSQSLIVTVDEREAKHTWCELSVSASTTPRCYLLDAHGFVYAETKDKVGFVFEGGLLPVDPLGQTFLRGRLDGVTAQLVAFAGIGLSPTGARVDNDAEFTIHIDGAFDIKTRFDVDGDATARNASLVLASEALAGRRSEIEYLDLRYGNRVYFKMKGSDGSEESSVDEQGVVE